MTLAAIAALVQFGGRVYTGGILHRGPTLKLRDPWQGTTARRDDMVATGTPPIDTRPRPSDAGQRDLDTVTTGRLTDRWMDVALIGVAVLIAAAVFLLFDDAVIGIAVGAGCYAILNRIVKARLVAPIGTTAINGIARGAVPARRSPARPDLASPLSRAPSNDRGPLTLPPERDEHMRRHAPLDHDHAHVHDEHHQHDHDADPPTTRAVRTPAPSRRARPLPTTRQRHPSPIPTLHVSDSGLRLPPLTGHVCYAAWSARD
jgi:hypothetical protein